MLSFPGYLQHALYYSINVLLKENVDIRQGTWPSFFKEDEKN